MDARCQDNSSTHGSTSDDTGSSMSTVVDRFSTSDRFSTVSTISTASTTSEHPSDIAKDLLDSYETSTTNEDLSLSKVLLNPFDQLEREFNSNPPDYLLKKLAISEAVTHVESIGEIEKITAVVAPNTVLIEETITLQPPLSFQDAPLSYGHEAKPSLFYTADLATDSTTHFRPIKDDAKIVECVNGNYREDELSEKIARLSDVTNEDDPVLTKTIVNNNNEIMHTDKMIRRREDEDEDSYKSLDEVSEDLQIVETKFMARKEDEQDLSDDSADDDYYWQNNLATIGEEEESNSLEYTNT